MGTLCGKPEDDDDEYCEEAEYVERTRFPQGYYQPGNNDSQVHRNVAQIDRSRMDRSPILCQALQSASGVVGAVVRLDVLDPYDLDEKIRRAKAQMRTVTVRDECLYIDYEFVGRIPPGVLVKAY